MFANLARIVGRILIVGNHPDDALMPLEHIKDCAFDRAEEIRVGIFSIWTPRRCYRIHLVCNRRFIVRPLEDYLGGMLAWYLPFLIEGRKDHIDASQLR